uniref:Uncharacterized protein n=1 Tax=Tetradesmus obliquus TaxID=3088 RepID=A0A383VGH9_TETOB
MLLFAGSYQLFDSQHHSKRGAAGFGAAANLLLGDCFCDELAGSLHGQAAGDTASNQLAAWHGWCTFWFPKGVVGAMQAGDRPTVDQLRRDATKGLLAFLPTAASKVAEKHLRRKRRAEAADVGHLKPLIELAAPLPSCCCPRSALHSWLHL